MYNCISYFVINPLECTGNHSARSNNMKLVRWPLIGGLVSYSTTTSITMTTTRTSTSTTSTTTTSTTRTTSSSTMTTTIT